MILQFLNIHLLHTGCLYLDLRSHHDPSSITWVAVLSLSLCSSVSSARVGRAGVAPSVGSPLIQKGCISGG